jgi:hypothetical protein
MVRQVTISDGIEVFAPPSHDQSMLLEKFWLVAGRCTRLPSLWLTCLSMAGSVPSADSRMALHAMVRKPCPHTSWVLSSPVLHIIWFAMFLGGPVSMLVIAGKHQFGKAIHAPQQFQNLYDLSR